MPTAPIPTPDGNLEGEFDPNEVFSRPWSEAPWIIRCVAFHGAWLYALFAFCAFMSSISSEENSTDLRIWYVTLGVLCLATTIYLRVGLKRHDKAAWRLQAALFLTSLFLIPVGTILGLPLLLEWDLPETRAWFGLKPARRKGKSLFNRLSARK